VHPFRVKRLRWLTCFVGAIWAVAATVAVANPFPSPPSVRALLLVTAVYFAGVGLYRWLAPDEAR
jgi:hypothetical protein